MTPPELRAGGAIFARMGQAFLELAQSLDDGDDETRVRAAGDIIKLMGATVALMKVAGDLNPEQMDAYAADVGRGAQEIASEFGETDYDGKRVACEQARVEYVRIRTGTDADYATPQARALIDTLMDFFGPGRSE